MIRIYLGSKGNDRFDRYWRSNDQYMNHVRHLSLYLRYPSKSSTCCSLPSLPTFVLAQENSTFAFAWSSFVQCCIQWHCSPVSLEWMDQDIMVPLWQSECIMFESPIHHMFIFNLPILLILLQGLYLVSMLIPRLHWVVICQSTGFQLSVASPRA